MQKKKYALLGFPLIHSMSPFIHKRLFELSGEEFEYDLIEISPGGLPERMKGFLNVYAGLNVTIPHKRAVIPFISQLDENARLFASVNLIDVKSGTGYNTDAGGFLSTLEMSGISLAGRIVVCGAGGAGRMMAILAAQAVGTVTVAVREKNLPQAKTLSAEIKEKTGAEALITTLNSLGGEISLLINATPAGMYPHSESMPVNPEILKKTAAVFDAVYNPRETLLLKYAAANGSKTAGGMPMLVFQAAEAHKIWYGAEYNKEDILDLISEANEYLFNNFRAN